MSIKPSMFVLGVIFDLANNYNCALVNKKFYNIIVKNSVICSHCNKFTKIFGINPLDSALQAYNEQYLVEKSESKTSDRSLWGIFLAGILGGLVALVTPCVWPMIPLTVSFFIKRNKKKGIKDATIYGLSIVIIYVSLGLLITLILIAKGSR